ncbi:MAG: FAD-dependent oxidoreductase [Eubacterium sp.]|nr:FAD-dependent oxidoreductase [Eubacterium sp.]
MKEKNCDVLVLGGGGAGLVAGVRAAEAGKKVTVLEKAGFFGGGMLFASTMRIFKSKWQAERNIPDQSVKFMREMMDLTMWQLDAELVKRAIYSTGEFFDWYSEHETKENMAKYEPRPYVFDIPVNGQVCPQVDKFHNGSGKLFVNAMLSYGKELGVEFLLEHSAKKAVKEGEKIKGIVADTPDGEVLFAFDKLIIASGSWIKNDEIMKKVLPAFLDADVEKNAHQNPAYTGEGITIGEELGAMIDWDSMCLRIMGPLAATGDRSNLDNLAHAEQIILVNEEGNRFVAEPMAPRIDPFSTGHVLLRQPHARSFYVYSKDMLEKIIDSTRENAAKEDTDIFGMPPLPDYEVIYGWMKDAQDKNQAWCAIGDTLNEAAKKIGINPDNLKATIEKYNLCCDKGEDTEFFKASENLIPLKEGPYFIVAGKLSTDGAFGGLRADKNMNVYKADGKSVFDNIYVCGDIASGRHIVDGNVKKQVLNDMSWAVASGFIAGTEAGK